MTVVPFQAVIPERDGVQNYAEVLARDAGEAILSWAIEGAKKFIRNGCKLDIPDAVEKATDAYRQREDWLNSFLEERCVRDERARTAARALYLEYRSWASDSGEFVRRENDCSAAMEDLGFRKVKISGKPTYKGISIDTDTLLSRVS